MAVDNKVRDELTAYPSLARGLYRIEGLAGSTTEMMHLLP
jgi:hypothetical protein